ncbi:hypothetical protein ACFLUY_03610 [Chloroflexota bacterium]
MTQKNNEASKKAYRVVQIEGKVTWRVEELWDGGIIREPYGSQHAAIKNEERIAQENGFFDDLVLQEVIGEEVMPANAFEKVSGGNWRCLKACTINVENKAVVFTEGMEFEEGTPFMGIDVAQWLDENYSSYQRM